MRPTPGSDDDRYSRQVLLPMIGPEGQRRLGEARVLVVGCGALGCVLADTLVRAGVGTLRLVDRDLVERNNLQRQVLYDEEDASSGLPKAEAAARRLRAVNSSVRIEAVVADVTARNVEGLLGGMALVLDGTDNFETRYLLNDACVKTHTPWIYGGALGTAGMTVNILPGEGPCLRCLFPEPPPAGTFPTCDTAGVLGSVPVTVASIQAAEALKVLVGSEAVRRDLLSLDLWSGTFRRTEVRRDPDCPACGRRRFEFLEGRPPAWATVLCGRNAVQVTPPEGAGTLALEGLAASLARVGEVSWNGLLLRFAAGGHEMVLFPDGRALVKGTTDPALARAFYARYVGV